MILAARLMTPDEFLDWRQSQPGRWELVSGQPLQMMAGAKRKHDRIVVNLIASLRPRLKGGPCEPTTDDIAVRIPTGNLRQPDVTIDCGVMGPDDMTAAAPTVVFEVLSKSTRTIDQVRKLDEYKLVETLRHIVLIEPDGPTVLMWSRTRGDEAWSIATIEGLEGQLALTAVNITLPLSEVYDGLTFEPAAP
jgi:Uma2 family endonuclease